MSHGLLDLAGLIDPYARLESLPGGFVQPITVDQTDDLFNGVDLLLVTERVFRPVRNGWRKRGEQPR